MKEKKSVKKIKINDEISSNMGYAIFCSRKEKKIKTTKEKLKKK